MTAILTQRFYNFTRSLAEIRRVASIQREWLIRAKFAFFQIDKKSEVKRLEQSLDQLSFNAAQIVARVRNRTGKRILHCIRPKRRTANKEIVVITCKLESALNALRSTIDSAKRADSSQKRELIRIARLQRNDVDLLINHIEAILNF